MNKPKEPVQLTRIKERFQQANKVSQLVKIRKQVKKFRGLVREERLGRDVAIEAAVLSVQIERRLGEVLADLPLAKAAPGNQYTGRRRKSSRDNGAVFVRDIGLTHSTSSRAQRIAGLPNCVFDDYLSASTKAKREPSISGLLRLVQVHGNNGKVKTP